MSDALTTDPYLRQRDGGSVALIRRPQRTCPFGGRMRLPQNQPKTARPAAKMTQQASRSAGHASKLWNYGPFGDNAINEIMAFRVQGWRAGARF
jgi:hypothetical protein